MLLVVEINIKRLMYQIIWIPKIGQIIYVIDDNQLHMRRVVDVTVRYSGNERNCE
jgi:hypothetical protein